MVYLIVTNDDGARWIGPEIGFLSFTIDLEEVERKVAILQYALTECGLVIQWEPWFPVYGSDAYVHSNQEELDRWVEKQNDKGDQRPYAPAEQP